MTGETVHHCQFKALAVAVSDSCAAPLAVQGIPFPDIVSWFLSLPPAKPSPLFDSVDKVCVDGGIGYALLLLTTKGIFSYPRSRGCW